MKFAVSAGIKVIRTTLGFDAIRDFLDAAWQGFRPAPQFAFARPRNQRNHRRFARR